MVKRILPPLLLLLLLVVVVVSPLQKASAPFAGYLLVKDHLMLNPDDAVPVRYLQLYRPIAHSKYRSHALNEFQTGASHAFITRARASWTAACLFARRDRVARVLGWRVHCEAAVIARAAAATFLSPHAASPSQMVLAAGSGRRRKEMQASAM